MYIAKYINIDKSGLNPELKVTVLFSNGTNEIENTYDVLPKDLESDTFKTIVQNQLDILNAKENVQKTDLDALIDTEISIIKDSNPVEEIIP